VISYFEAESSGNILRGMLHEGYKAIPVIIIHGFFSSNKIGSYRLYFEMADFLNRSGYTVLRVDLSGMGESDGDIRNIVFQTHVNDICATIRKIAIEKSVERFHLVAHCVGCCTVLASLKEIREMVETISFVSPFIPTETNYRKLFGAVEYDSFGKKPIYHNGMYCDDSFVHAGKLLFNDQLLKEGMQNKLTVFFPEKDELSLLDESVLWAKRNSIDYRLIPNGDHNFHDMTSRKCLYTLIKEKIDGKDGFYIYQACRS